MHSEVFQTEVVTAIRGIVCRRLRVTLGAHDGRHRNLDAQDLVADIQLKILHRLTHEGADPGLRDVRSYAAVVAYHACAEYLSEQCPHWCRLRNLLRRVVDKSAQFAVWRQEDLAQLFSGYVGWRHRPPPVAQAIVDRLLADPHPLSGLPQRHLERMRVEDWIALLDALFGCTCSPVLLDDTTSIAARMCGIEELNEESMDGDAEALPATSTRTPYAELLMRQRLLLLWRAILELLPWHRAAFLLNMPDGELESFTYYRVASLSEIGGALQFTQDQIALLWAQLPLSAADREELRTLTTYDDAFAMVYKHIPLQDNAIAAVLGVSRAQVIGYRRKAVERLRRHLRPAV